MNFSTSISFMKIYINTCPMARKRRWSFTPHPNKATLAEDKGAPDRIDSTLDTKWYHAPNVGDHRQEDRN
jgi:hypothetical protein